MPRQLLLPLLFVMMTLPGCNKKDEPEADATVRLAPKQENQTKTAQAPPKNVIKRVITPEEKAPAAKFLLEKKKTQVAVTSLNAVRIGKGKGPVALVKVPAGGLKIRGDIRRSTVSEILQVHEKEIRYCYEKYLLLHPGLRGKVVMEWVVTKKGTVSVVKTKENTMKTPHVPMCLSPLIKKWKYPPFPDGIAVVSQKFIFNHVDR